MPMKMPTIKIKRTLMFMLHWRIGVIAAIFILWIAVSGIILNHSRDMGLDQVYLDSPILMKLYNMDVPEGYVVQVSKAENSTIVKTQDGILTLKPDEDIAEAVATAYRGEGVVIEKVVLDLHTGKLFGISGTLVSDLAALAMIFLTLSGTYNVWRRKKKK